ncbi:protein ERD1 homolog 1-like isoform X3 [Arachis ipaensis]|uniref:protein ERD1 homolog 1-like isoform X3 n=1 Tax=Arachis ipaensis TaxID=130454 RepID=UPI000A2B4788|nr:protein ERD1 homolog 1-like isoform X3 [Arachis ipaensis]XP_025646431.1 protein ERD1 homolog 1 isoform X3 [Arachis hypogaea]
MARQYHSLISSWLIFSLPWQRFFSDLEHSICRMVHRQIATIAWLEADSVCGSHSVAIPLVLVLLYLFHLNQCLRQYKDTGEKTCLLNALKYSTAVPVIFLSALKYHVFPDKWTNFYRPLWLLSSVVNSSYSLYWDVNRDWDLSFMQAAFPVTSSHGAHYCYQWSYCQKSCPKSKVIGTRPDVENLILGKQMRNRKI